MKKCIYCGQEIDDGSVFCGYCGKEQPKVKYCIKCGQDISLDDAYCGYCGASQIVEIQEADVECDEHEAPNEVVQTVNDESTEKTKADVTSQSQEVETVDEADEKQESMTSPTEQIEKAVEEKQLEEVTNKDNGNESSEKSYSIDFDEDNNSNNIKRYIIIALVTALILFGGYGAYRYFINKSDSDITNEEVIDNMEIALKGTINNTIGFTMQLSMTGNTIEGTEHYDNQRKDVNLIVKGSKSDNGTILLSEYDGSTTAGTFEGTIENGVFSGNFTNAKGKTFPFYADVSILRGNGQAGMECPTYEGGEKAYSDTANSRECDCYNCCNGDCKETDDVVEEPDSRGGESIYVCKYCLGHGMVQGGGECLPHDGNKSTSTCPKCNGQGEIDCPTCEGSGRTFSDEVGSFPCTDCGGEDYKYGEDGTGKIKCPVCKGTKTIQQ